ncbi:nitric oxide reductase F protein [Paracoccus sp. (in: a-proteobacteria)]|uniref:nitric oxide reductase F protein n=1 Tax=Paracoccus sp. TaxID=267 RepID=UPI00321FCE1F
MDILTRAWLALIGLSAVSTVIALVLPRLDANGLKAASAVILVIAWLKARVILSRYLGLAAVPAIGRGFGLVLALFMLAAIGLYLAA